MINEAPKNHLKLAYQDNPELANKQPGDKVEMEITGTVTANDGVSLECTPDQVKCESMNEEGGEENTQEDIKGSPVMMVMGKGMGSEMKG